MTRIGCANNSEQTEASRHKTLSGDITENIISCEKICQSQMSWDQRTFKANTVVLEIRKFFTIYKSTVKFQAVTKTDVFTKQLI